MLLLNIKNDYEKKKSEKYLPTTKFKPADAQWALILPPSLDFTSLQLNSIVVPLQ